MKPKDLHRAVLKPESLRQVNLSVLSLPGGGGTGLEREGERQGMREGGRSSRLLAVRVLCLCCLSPSPTSSSLCCICVPALFGGIIPGPHSLSLSLSFSLSLCLGLCLIPFLSLGFHVRVITPAVLSVSQPLVRVQFLPLFLISFLTLMD